MITGEQEKWIEHLSDRDKIKIYPYDSLSGAKFDRIAKKIKIASPQATIELRGAAGLKISGQKEIDVYISVAPADFDDCVNKVAAIFGKPRSCYFLQRARFVDYVDQTKAEIFVINKESDQWLNCLKFENYLAAHSAARARYEKLKESGHNLSVRKYYRRKTEFINSILAAAK